MNLKQITDLLALPSQGNIEIKALSTDSRQVTPGCLFVALQGENFDGHDFVPDVAAKGAVAVLVKRAIPGVNLIQLVVEDPLIALGKIAALSRKKMKGSVIALTGSNGKTTVKEMIASILPKPSLATRGNLNNHIGVPLTLLQLEPEHRYAVFELGANHLGEIAYTVNLVQPDVALINNIGPAHIEGFGSIEGVARAKGEIYAGLHKGGVAVVNEDDKFSHYWDSLLQDKKVVRFSIHKKSDFYATDYHSNESGQSVFLLNYPKGQVEITLNVPGEHNVSNAVAAAACCYSAGIAIQEIVQGLQGFTGVAGRLTCLKGKNDAVIIDDTYNANLRSVTTALTVLSHKPGKRIFVFGDMGELGSESLAHHQEVGLYAKTLGIDQLLACGNASRLTVEAFGHSGKFYASKEDLLKDLLPELKADTTILVKGSRSSAMEKIVHELVK